MHKTLKPRAHKLRLSGLIDSFELRLQDAENHRLPYSQHLKLDVDANGQIARRNKAASSPYTRACPGLRGAEQQRRSG